MGWYFLILFLALLVAENLMTLISAIIPYYIIGNFFLNYKNFLYTLC